MDSHSDPSSDNNPIIEVLSEDIEPRIDRAWWDEKNIIQALSHNEILTNLHIYANTTIWNKCGLSPKEVEFVILTVCREIDFEFGWHHHIQKAIKMGLDENDILQISSGNDQHFSEEMSLLMRFVGMIASERYDNELKQDLMNHYPDDTIIGIAMLSSYYIFIYYMAIALDVHLTEEFFGWELENL